MELTSNPIVIFGAGSFSQLASFTLTNNQNYNVVTHVVDDAYIKSISDFTIPVVAFSSLKEKFPPAKYSAIVSLGYRAINGLRRERYEQMKDMGYEMCSFIHPSANVWSEFKLGSNVIVFEGALIQPYVIVGNNVIIRSGAIVGHHSAVGSHSFIASGVITGGNVKIGEQSFIGLGAVIRDNITIAERSFIGAGAVVIADTEPDGVYVGNPARKLPNRTSFDVTK